MKNRKRPSRLIALLGALLSAQVAICLLVHGQTNLIQPVVPLALGHVDLAVTYDAAATHALSLVVRDESQQVEYETNETVLVVAEAAKLALPPGTPFGDEGAPLWVLPQTQNPAVLFVGLSAEEIPSDLFIGNLTLRLRAVEGPGQFFLWQASQAGLDIHMNSADGISEDDVHPQIVGSHEHANFGFTSNGVYHVTFQVSGRLAGQSTNITSLESPFTFHVLPLPTNAPPAIIELSNATWLPSGSFAFDVGGAETLTIEVQDTEDFKTWIGVTNVAVSTSPQTVTLLPDPTKRRRFIRVQAP